MNIHSPDSQDWPYQYEYSTGAQSKWHIKRESDGYYTIRSMYGDQYYIGISGAAIGNRIELYSSVSDRARWKIYAKSSGELFFVPKSAPGMVIAAADNNLESTLMLRWMSESIEYRNLWRFQMEAPTDLLEAQLYSEWCWVASSRMFAKHYTESQSSLQNMPSQATAVAEIKGDSYNITGSLNESFNAVNYFLTGNTSQNILGLVFYESKQYAAETLLLFLNDCNILWIGRHSYDGDGDMEVGHASIIAGYSIEFSKGSIIYYYTILDPWPSNSDATAIPWGSQENLNGQRYEWS